MSSIPLPALGIKPPESADLLQKVGQIGALKNQQQAGQIQGQQLQQEKMQTAQMQRQQASYQALQQALAAKPGSTLHDVLPGLASKMDPQSWMTWDKADREQQKEVRDADAGKLANMAAAEKQKGALYEGVMGMSDDQTVVQNWPQIAETWNAIPGNKTQLDPQKPMTKDQLSNLAPIIPLRQAYVDKELADREQKAKTSSAETKQQQDARVLAGTSPTGITADQQATIAQGQTRINLEKSGQFESRRHNLAMEGSLTSEGLSMAAQQFATTGVMPSLGRSSAIRAQIVNEAARLYPKIDLASNQAAFKANQASLDNVTKTLDTLTAFENTGLKNLKQFTDLAAKIPDTGVPWTNTPVRMLSRQIVGSENMAAVEAARNVALREIARVTNDPKLSGALTDSSRQEVANLIPQNATFKQIKAVAKVLQQDMANVHGSLADQRDAIKARIGVGKDTSQATPGGTQPAASDDPFAQFGGKSRQ